MKSNRSQLAFGGAHIKESPGCVLFREMLDCIDAKDEIRLGLVRK